MLRQLLDESGIPSNPAVDDEWILTRIAAIVRAKVRKTPRIGVNVFVKKEGKILLGQRTGGTGEGQWCLPGGKLEFNERLEVCALREVKEECGIDLQEIKFVNLNSDPRGHEHWIHINYEGETEQEPVLVEPECFTAWGWFRPDQLPDPVFFGHRKLIDAYLNSQIVSD
jgi:8-oxo-dGTP diphosphatase